MKPFIIFLFFVTCFVGCKSTTHIKLEQQQPEQQQNIDIDSQTTLQNQTIALYIGAGIGEHSHDTE